MIPESDATPDEAFELGEVHGYDKGYAEGLAARAEAWALGFRAGYDHQHNDGAVYLNDNPYLMLDASDD